MNSDLSATQVPRPIDPRVPGGPPPPEPPVVPPDDPNLPDVHREPSIDPPRDPAPIGVPSEPPPGLVADSSAPGFAPYRRDTRHHHHAAKQSFGGWMCCGRHLRSFSRANDAASAAAAS